MMVSNNLGSTESPKRANTAARTLWCVSSLPVWPVVVSVLLAGTGWTEASCIGNEALGEAIFVIYGRSGAQGG